MKKSKNLSQLHKDISGNLLDSIRLIEVLEELNDGEPKQGILLDALNQKINSAFHKTIKCRKMISIQD